MDSYISIAAFVGGYSLAIITLVGGMLLAKHVFAVSK